MERIRYNVIAKSEDGKYIDSISYDLKEFYDENIIAIRNVLESSSNDVIVDGSAGITIVKGKEPFYYIQENTRDEKLSKEVKYMFEDLKDENSNLYKYVYLPSKLELEEFAFILIEILIGERTSFRPNTTRMCAKALFGFNYFKFDLENDIWEDDIKDGMTRLGFDTYIHRTLKELDMAYLLKYVLPNFYDSLIYLKDPYDKGVRDFMNYTLEID